MGKEDWKQQGKRGHCTEKKDCWQEQETRKLVYDDDEGFGKNRIKVNASKAGEHSLLNRPSEWTAKNIDEVAAAVREEPWAEAASAFWNIYRGPFSDVPCNEVLRSIIVKAKRSYATYYPIPEEDYLGDVVALMGEKMLSDWMPEKESLENYIRCRCRPNAEYGRSILKAHGNKVYSLVKGDGHGSFHVCEISKYNIDAHPDYTRKYINQHLLSIDDIARNEKAYPFYGLGIAVQEDGFCRIEQKSVRSWLMKTCNISEYELQICELIAAHGKRINSESVEEINETVVLPAGNPPMTQKELSALNHRVHVRARRHYWEAIKGIR
ncbi:MAG: hypothetical protein Q4C66_12745 [Lachnospiraceae bacterium]|nr:hypothetical protein [Lachnospiraceae bacterium]